LGCTTMEDDIATKFSRRLHFLLRLPGSSFCILHHLRASLAFVSSPPSSSLPSRPFTAVTLLHPHPLATNVFLALPCITNILSSTLFIALSAFIYIYYITLYIALSALLLIIQTAHAQQLYSALMYTLHSNFRFYISTVYSFQASLYCTIYYYVTVCYT
jgi:hypothetical protein